MGMTRTLVRTGISRIEYTLSDNMHASVVSAPPSGLSKHLREAELDSIAK
jgi:hypothetical protein